MYFAGKFKWQNPWLDSYQMWIVYFSSEFLHSIPDYEQILKFQNKFKFFWFFSAMTESYLLSLERHQIWFMAGEYFSDFIHQLSRYVYSKFWVSPDKVQCSLTLCVNVSFQSEEWHFWYLKIEESRIAQKRILCLEFREKNM